VKTAKKIRQIVKKIEIIRKSVAKKIRLYYNGNVSLGLYGTKKRGEFRMIKVQVDRFEEGFAVLTDDEEKLYHVPREQFPFEIHEGDILRVEFVGGHLQYAEFLAEETAEMRERIAALMKKLKRKS